MKSNYHHGNLREILVSKSVDILNEKGVKGLSVRAVAKLAGVSEAAPYSHFKNKEELLEAVATQGYIELKRCLDEASVLTDFAMIERLAIGYVSFATENVPLFRLMFGRELPEQAFSEDYREVGSQCYESIFAEVARLLDDHDGDTQQTVEEITTAAWAIVHGLSFLLIDGKVSLPEGELERRCFIANRCRVITLALSALG
ncbi:TetR/AcrR family transcriptional regulator [Marinomonas sp.]|nr:TetR/AcrR family transcriptional regulator [Marinomonas sp.]MDB4837170.1 TetR/AcrR family transcriptional regulator [Marinomonas sp.]